MAGGLLLLALAAGALLGALLLDGRRSEALGPRAQLTAAVLPAPE